MDRIPNAAYVRSDNCGSIILWNVADVTHYPLNVLFNDTADR